MIFDIHSSKDIYFKNLKDVWVGKVGRRLVEKLYRTRIREVLYLSSVLMGISSAHVFSYIRRNQWIRIVNSKNTGYLNGEAFISKFN